MSDCKEFITCLPPPPSGEKVGADLGAVEWPADATLHLRSSAEIERELLIGGIAGTKLFFLPWFVTSTVE